MQSVVLIEWNREKFERFKRLYHAARAKGLTEKHTFMFEGHEVVIGYAKYLIEYLETKLEK